MIAGPDNAIDSDEPLSQHQRQFQEQQSGPQGFNSDVEGTDLRGRSPNPPTRRLRLKVRPLDTTLPSANVDADYSPNHPESPMVATTRRSTRTHHNGPRSGSEYSANGGSVRSASSSRSPVESRLQARRTRSTKPHYRFDDDEDDDEAYIQKHQPVMTTTMSSRGRTIRLRNPNLAESDDEDEHPPRPAGASRRMTRGLRKRRDSFIDDEDDEEDEEEEGSQGYKTRSRSKKDDIQETDVKPEVEPPADGDAPLPPRRAHRSVKRRSARAVEEEGDYVDDGPSHSSIDMDADGSVDHDDPVPSTPEEPPQRTPTPEETGGYGLRKRTTRVDYTLPPPLAPEEIGPNVNGNSNGGVDNLLLNGNKGKGRPNFQRDYRKVAPWGVAGRFTGNDIGGIGRPRPPDDSDSDVPTQTPRRPFGAAAGGPSGLFAGGLGPAELAAAAAGTPSNLGKVGTDSALADADPLGVNQNVTFDEVGGLDDHINSLKEMVTLPLLYPEVFQQFNLTPPRGVLFHGPPGTGKTLLARALAASSRSGGRSITFYMRKGADCLSKWVGEAERQLRLLFDEARANQPSIIFFDEIDGLAPVRSSKQDQIHASIVSTLLALMDGMDGRGQVIVIGATNRPDSIDPALRRPGRFDREFYFPLPALPARQKILSIVTRKWVGWEGEKGDETRLMLAKATKGYGGADLRALCTEAALNAVQRRYPQIYKSNDRLLVKPDTIQVQAKDFMIALKKMIPSSARSTASEAKPLPSQLVPLLGGVLERAKKALDDAIPSTRKRNILEEAEYEEEEEAGGLEREMMLQAMETLRVHRPRIVVHGSVGMGQTYIGAAALHHMEGSQVQSLDLGTLMSDSTRTVETAIVQLFVEAKRHKPSIIYIPSLLSWCAAVSETARTTVRTMLDSLAPTDPLLLLAVVDGEFAQLPRDVKAWFGHNREYRIALESPTREMREEFFADLLAHVHRPPSQFPDAIVRKKRVLEKLPLAPPLPPKLPTPAEIATQAENDERIRALLTHRLGPVLQDLKRKFKRFAKSTRNEYDLDADPEENPIWQLTNESQPETQPQPQPQPNGIVDGDGDAAMTNGIPVPVEESSPRVARHLHFFDMDLEKMHAKLYYGGYLTPKEFLEDILKIVANAEVEPIDNERLFKAQAMYHSTNATLLSWEPQFAIECERMAGREMERRRQQRKQDKSKTKALEPPQPYAPGTRRSARANGQDPELPFTPDPERKLKRPRSHLGIGTPSASDQESMGRRTPKRARTASEERSDFLQGATNALLANPGDVGNQHQPQQARAVRFASEPGLAQSDISSNPANIHDNLEGPGTPTPLRVGLPLITAAQLAALPSPGLLNQPPAQPEQLTVVEAVTIDGDHRPQEPAQASETFQAPVPEIVVDQPSDDVVMQEAHTPSRTPTPPPPMPDFHIDEDLVAQLRTKLVVLTGGCTVEQLEQLRAACLSCLWKSRSSWNRDDVLREMMAVVDEFVKEVSADDPEFSV
ncbi:hypothetical protein FRB99_005742 [Tulasnella sp. 403]|nr:hypothetical protein FRB99_005742 [Tulasnella sp. 403]